MHSSRTLPTAYDLKAVFASFASILDVLLGMYISEESLNPKINVWKHNFQIEELIWSKVTLSQIEFLNDFAIL